MSSLRNLFVLSMLSFLLTSSRNFYEVLSVISFIKVDKLSPYHKNNLEINLKFDAKSSFRPIYKLLKNKYEFLYKYLNNNFISKFI